MFGLFRNWRRKRLHRRPFPAEWLDHLNDHVPFFKVLPDSQRREFLDKLKVFVWEKNWEGANGLQITDEHRVVIGATAARLVLALDLDYYNKILSIVVYPGHYKHPGKSQTVVFGQVNHWGTVVLSWKSVLDGLKQPTDGRDTTVHEFAHALDLASGGFDGTPPLRSRSHVRPWIDVMTHHFEQLQDRERQRPGDLLRDYGAQNPAEFFAVASEVFFERPAAFKEKKPALFAELRRFYGWDPVTGAREPVIQRKKPSRRERNRAKRRRTARD